MKQLTLVLITSLLFISGAFAQTPYNPFTQNIHFAPEPSIAGFPCGSIQTVAFTQGLTTADNATQWQTDPLTITICLTGFTFNGSASTVVSGTYAGNFDWAFSTTNPNCIIGTQNQTLIGTGSNPIFPDPLSSGDIQLSLKVPEGSPISTILSVDVTLQVPAYMQAFNSAPDDNESTQTQTYCELKITGTVFHDSDTINQVNDVNGTPINNPGGVQLYANLIDANGIVVAVTTIDSNGYYEFLNVTPNTNYTVILSINQGTVGLSTPIIELPPLWDNTGEDCCDNSGNDGNTNGVIEVSVTDHSVFNVNFGINSLPSTGLPTVLQGFFVNEYNCGGLLSWTTSQEENSSHVDIYRKGGLQNQSDFKKIATVKSAGNSNEIKVYSYLDKDVVKDGRYEYQLKFVDIDGRFTQSDIKTLSLNCKNANTSINIYPNPATSIMKVLFVSEQDNTNLEVSVIDIAGRKLLTKSETTKNGITVMSLDVSSFARGTYFLNYKDQDGIIVGSEKFIKQ